MFRIVQNSDTVPLRSNVFRAMLMNDMREKATKVIKLEDVEPDVFRVCLFFLLLIRDGSDKRPFPDIRSSPISGWEILNSPFYKYNKK